MLLTMVILMVLVVGAQSYVIYNLLKKVEVYEDFCTSILDEIKFILDQITQIDALGSFESDDETGVIYTGIKTMVNRLSTFTEE